MVISIDRLLHTLTRVVNALQEADVPFAVAGGCAVYAHGGPATDHDVDILVKPPDAARARQVLVHAGLRAADPAEDWLIKAYDGDVLVDLIFQPNQRPVTDALLARATRIRIGPATAPVIPATDLMIDKLMVLEPHRLDFTGLLHIARELREQVDWVRVRAEASVSPYARAFIGLLEDLHITDSGSAAGDPPGEVLPQYLEANLRRALAEDPRTAELAVQVSIRGDTVVLCGEVGSAEHRRQLANLAHQQVPKLHLQNDIRVTSTAAPTDHERLD
jgi:hypothetical protein